MSEQAVIAEYIERVSQDVIAELRKLSDAQLNRPLPIPDTNTIYAIATHYVGMGEFWVLSLVGGQPSQRNRSAEFQAAGTGEAVIARIQAWVIQAKALLAAMPAERLDAFASPPASFAGSGGFKPDAPLTCRQCLMHVVEHCATHLGHIQLTKDLLLALDDGRLSVR
jgi:hypothetical protein